MSKKRNLSDFLAKELLYDYSSGQLDESRKVALEAVLKESDEVASDLKALREGLKFCEALRNTKLSEPYFQFLSLRPKTLKDRAKGWSQLRPAFRYGIEAGTILFIFVSIGVVTPKQYRFWEKDSEFTVVEWKRDKPTTQTTQTQSEEISSTTTVLETVDVPVKASKPYGPPTTLLEAAAPAVSSPSRPVAQVESKSEVKGEAKGEIIRATLSGSNLDEWTPLVVDKVISLGGIKAGEVQLGWRRKGGSYFHFTLPESNFDSFKEFLQTLGPVRIVREPHPRVMPEGTIRLILWIEQGSRIKTEKNDDRTSN